MTETPSFVHPGGYRRITFLLFESGPDQPRTGCRVPLGRRLAGASPVFVVTEHAENQVVAYYAWCMAQVQPDKATVRLGKGAGWYPQPVALLARLGVDTEHEGRGLGVGLLQDVFARLFELSADIGCRGLIVHAESAESREFYLHLVPEFEQSTTDDLHLLVLMKDIRRTAS